jgi:anti-sigma factor RsiW
MIRRFLGRRRFMREHRWTQAHLSGYLDRELRPGDAARAEAHLGICPHCQRVLATLRRTLEGLRSLADERPPGVVESVLDRLRHQH